MNVPYTENVWVVLVHQHMIVAHKRMNCFKTEEPKIGSMIKVSTKTDHIINKISLPIMNSEDYLVIESNSILLYIGSEKQFYTDPYTKIYKFIYENKLLFSNDPNQKDWLRLFNWKLIKDQNKWLLNTGQN